MNLPQTDDKIESTSPGQHRKNDPVDGEQGDWPCMGKLALPSSAKLQYWAESPASPPQVGGKDGPEVIRAGKLSQPLTSCSTWEFNPCSCICNRVEQALMVWV